MSLLLSCLEWAASRTCDVWAEQRNVASDPCSCLTASPQRRYYSRAEAWTVPAGMREALARVRAAGVKTCVVSNFDNRLRPLLATLALDSLFDSIVVSSEVGAEKPSPKIFDAACVATGVDPSRELVVHVGDDRRNDVWGARASGISGWLWGDDVTSFEEIADRIVTGHMAI